MSETCSAAWQKVSKASAISEWWSRIECVLQQNGGRKKHFYLSYDQLQVATLIGRNAIT